MAPGLCISLEPAIRLEHEERRDVHAVLGKGSREEIRPGVWRVRHNLGYDPISKRYVYSPWRTIHTTSKRELNAFAEDYKHELYILNNTRRRFITSGDGPREEIPEIPTKAVREALMNAYAHRDWLSLDCVQINIFSDSVEIDSPGWFVPPWATSPLVSMPANGTSPVKAGRA